ncbi:hypothetical protein BBO99_00000166 [Phytophthora kernoviae]|uniref:Uncharacterized protein n=2 Tax=Phytophthora kernoviae TaxID=325452 RepID=A0A3R7H5Q6_9STRA|nr:hypothetical protein G195_001396 [Phytophthora kernoviae 00238/432]KAG2531460.1 hypothetical protein JM18_000373 [Phytophthora kernoviae]RLM96826.1 hypothetical protein BBI17_000268 [Phytophthora kernoviae]RLN85849.1 hypothetical protein BBO99_00000166 [Phytophthora kernoviae]
MLRQVMKKRGTRNARMLQECLAVDPYNLKLSYEVVRRRVKRLLDEETAKPSGDTGLDNSGQVDGKTSKQKEAERTESSGDKEVEGLAIEVKDADSGEINMEETKELDHEAIARDLDMLANTVRSIATHVVGYEGGEGIYTAVDMVEGGDKVVSLVPSQDPEPNGEDSIEAATPATSEFSLTAPSDELDKEQESSNSMNATSDSDVMPSGEELTTVQEIEDEAVGETRTSENDARSDTIKTDGIAAKRCAMEAASDDRLAPQPKKQKRAEYSEDTRALCARRHEEGASYAVISKELGIPHDTVRAIVRKVKRTGSVSSAPRSGRPRKTSGIIDKVILEAVRSNKQCSAKAIQEELQRVFGVKVSSETVRRRVLEHTKQRLLAASGGTSRDLTPSSSVAEDNNAAANDMMLDASATSSLGETAATKNLLDPVSFQQLLHEGEKPAVSMAPAVDILTASPSTATATTTIDGQSPAEPSCSSLYTAVTDVVMLSEAVPEASPPPEDKGQVSSSQSTQKRHKRGEYSVEVREQCVALHAQGQGYRRIGKSLKMPHTTVRAIVEKAQRTGSVLPAKRSGRPRKTDAIVDKVILQAVEANEKSSARVIQEQLLETFGIRVSCETIRRRVKDHSRQCLSTTASSTIPDTSLEADVIITESFCFELLSCKMAGTLARFFAGSSSTGAFAAIRSNERLLQDAQTLYNQILPSGGGTPLSGADESNSRSGDNEPDKIWALVAVVATGMTQEIKQETQDDDEMMKDPMTPLTWHLVQLLAEASVGLQEFLLYFTSLFNRLLLEPELLAATTLLKEEFTIATLLFEKYRVLWEALGPKGTQKKKQKKKAPTDPEPESAVYEQQEMQLVDRRRKLFEAGWLLFLLAKRRLSNHYSGLGQLYNLLLAVLHVVISNVQVSQPSVEAEVAAALSAMGALGDADAKPSVSNSAKTSVETLEALCAAPKVDPDDVLRASGHLGLVLQQLRDEKVLQEENGQHTNQGVTVFASGVDESLSRTKNLALVLFYRVLEPLLCSERERLRNNDFSKLLNNEVFLAALFACSAEVMLKAHSLITISYPFLLDHLHVNAFHFVTTMSRGPNVSQAAATMSFKRLLASYKQLSRQASDSTSASSSFGSQSTEGVTFNIKLDGESRGDIIKFYNRCYITPMKVFILQFQVQESQMAAADAVMAEASVK